MHGVAHTSVLRSDTTVLVSVDSLVAARYILSPVAEPETLQTIGIIGVGVVERIAVNADIHGLLVWVPVPHGVPRVDSHGHDHVRQENRRNNVVDSGREVPVIRDQAGGPPGTRQLRKISRRISRSWIDRRLRDR